MRGWPSDPAPRPGPASAPRHGPGGLRRRPTSGTPRRGRRGRRQRRAGSPARLGRQPSRPALVRLGPAGGGRCWASAPWAGPPGWALRAGQERRRPWRRPRGTAPRVGPSPGRRARCRRLLRTWRRPRRYRRRLVRRVVLRDGRVAISVGRRHGTAPHRRARLRPRRPDPGSVLVALTRFMAEVGIDDRFATTVQAWVDPADGTALIVSAGGPPPLLVQPDGRAEFVGLNALPPTGCGDIRPRRRPESNPARDPAGRVDADPLHRRTRLLLDDVQDDPAGKEGDGDANRRLRSDSSMTRPSSQPARTAATSRGRPERSVPPRYSVLMIPQTCPLRPASAVSWARKA